MSVEFDTYTLDKDNGKYINRKHYRLNKKDLKSRLKVKEINEIKTDNDLRAYIAQLKYQLFRLIAVIIWTCFMAAYAPSLIPAILDYLGG